MRRPDDDPGGLAWLVGLTSLILPWVGVPLACVGLFIGARGGATGWWMLATGVAMLLADALLTLFWARPASRQTDQPLLNRREAQYVGRTVRVVEAIAGGEGKVRVGDSVWRARGPDCIAGTWVKVVSADGTHLVVATDDERSPQ